MTIKKIKEQTTRHLKKAINVKEDQNKRKRNLGVNKEFKEKKTSQTHKYNILRNI